ncbi:MAG: metallophosphoesterase [Anaerolineae bacterium]|nr:metallophosphoesterase [Anaerolineae bacterium]
MPDRFLDLTDGVAVVVTDLHGDRDAFDRCLAHFGSLKWRGKADRLIVLGDLIHGYGSARQDDSLGMVLDLIKLRKEYGPDSVIMLLGNHEMPHIYGMLLAKGDIEFTPRFEHALGEFRHQVIAFFEELPFYIRTAAGVLLCHAGPSLDSIKHADVLRNFDHRTLLDTADLTLSQTDDLTPLYAHYRELYGVPYDEMAFRYLAIQGPHDPRYHHLLRAFMVGQQTPEVQILWDALFTQNEIGLTNDTYKTGCQAFLAAFAAEAPANQHAVVSGHIITPSGGHQLVNNYHLRVSSAAHARPRKAGCYLLLDCAQPVQDARDLVQHLRNVFD